MGQWPLRLGFRPVTVQLLLHGLTIFWFDIVRTWSGLSARPLQYGGDVPRCCFMDEPLAAHLGDQLLVLDLIGRQSSTKLVQQLRQLARLNACGPKDLESASFDAHYEVPFVRCTLSHDLVPCQQRVAVLSRPSGKRQHLCHALKTCFCF